MKRLIALILLICISALFFAVPTSAEGEVYVAAGNTVLPLSNALPIRSSGVWYIDYQCFSKGNLGVNTSYNSAESMLVLYTWDTTLIFDLKATIAYTAADKIQYKAVAFVANGTVYVPVQFTAQMLGFDYTYFSDLPMIRIKRSGDIQDNMFMYIAESEIEEMKKAAPKPSPSPDTTPTTPEPQKPIVKPEQTVPDKKNIRLTFNITDGKNMAKILNNLSRYGYRATFFIQGNAIQNCENEIRRAVISGHTLGILSMNGSEDFTRPDAELKKLLTSTNERLFEVSKTKTRLLRVPGRTSSLGNGRADSLISWGYRLWDSSIYPTGNSGTSVYNSAVSKIKSSGHSIVLELSDSNTHASALPRILQYFNSNEYSVSAINLTDSPVNDIADRR